MKYEPKFGDIVTFADAARWTGYFQLRPRDLTDVEKMGLGVIVSQHDLPYLFVDVFTERSPREELFLGDGCDIFRPWELIKVGSDLALANQLLRGLA